MFIVTNNGTVAIGGGSLIDIDDTLIVSSNSTVICGGWNTNTTNEFGEWVGVGVRINASNIIVDTDASINAAGQGYTCPGTYNNGNGPGGGMYNNGYGGGGGYGGNGGQGASPSSIGGSSYGDAFVPTNPGSAGAGGSTAPSVGHGGGAIRIDIYDTLTVNGSIGANGNNGSANYAGGGSGGSILAYIYNELTGSGNFTADGGDGGYYAGGGGGGRIAIYYHAESSFGGFATSITDGGDNGGSSAVDGESGSLYFFGEPYICITTTPETVSYDVTDYTIAGTNWAVFGVMNWTNSLTGGNGTFQVSGFGFQVSGIPLNIGDNIITVSGTNVFGDWGSNSVIITRGDIGTGTPFINITNVYGVIDYDESSVSIAGINNINVMGSIWWSNTTTSASGNTTRFTPGSNWWSAYVPLDHGNNQIIVSGTNLLNTVTNDIINIYRETWDDVQPFIKITNENTTVTYTVTSYTIGGTNNANVAGTMNWANSLGGSGTIPVSGVGFQVSGIPLNVGDNLITVSGTNVYGQSTNDVVTIQRKTAIESEPQIATNALIFPALNSMIYASQWTNIIWDFAKITDDVDATNLMISKITLHYADTTQLIADVESNVSNTLGEIEWYVSPGSWDGKTNYVLKFEVVDSSSLTNSRIFWYDKFTVIPEPGLFLILNFGFALLIYSKSRRAPGVCGV